ncbi:aminoglycoside phosphotransferase family protein [Streptomyces rhizosphaerihabitans]|uniref:aminoglycoside phosphotransferase family protein n=1 Tax=Streptomyces rhizosphaerihabitans TaxID=1266770 RepID=UPI0021C12792|nr:aminoglycoside phosphotransferase family protein [Streptomyces rhizosphaerihabitans]MCT9003627.1 aminoglycoside phosphotransferase family protein [Streptomyces rhizosphaerihabitans]
MAHQLPRRAHRVAVHVLARLRLRKLAGDAVVGHHNSNHILPLGQPLAVLLGVGSGKILAKFRTPKVTIEVVPRLWTRESDVLRAVRTQLPEAPRCLRDFGSWSLYEYVPGRVLSDAIPRGTIGRDRLEALAGFFAALAGVPVRELPVLPVHWPVDGDSTGFLNWLIDFTENRVHQCNRPRFGALFDEVGIPRDVMERFRRTVPVLTRRPFALLHTDVHRANVVLSRVSGGDGNLVVIDWELALFGDPLHDLATHLVRMDYDKAERESMIELWADAMRRAGHGDATAGLDGELGRYVAFEHVQSVFADVMRAAVGLLEKKPEAHDFRTTAEEVCEAVRKAREALGLDDEALNEVVTEGALRRWYESEGHSVATGVRTAKGHSGPKHSRERILAGRNPGSRAGGGSVGAAWLLRGAAWLLLTVAVKRVMRGSFSGAMRAVRQRVAFCSTSTVRSAGCFPRVRRCAWPTQSVAW